MSHTEPVRRSYIVVFCGVALNVTQEKSRFRSTSRSRHTQRPGDLVGVSCAAQWPKGSPRPKPKGGFSSAVTTE